MVHSAPLLLAAALALAVPGGEEASRGRLERLVLDSFALGGRHEVEIWVAPGAAAKEGPQVPVLYLLEGDGREFAGVAEALDRLVAEGRAASVLVVRVPPPARLSGLARSEALERFVVSELVPLVDHRYRTRREAAGRAVVAASGGSAGPLDLAARHPGVFGPCGESASRDARGPGALAGTLACLSGDDRVSLDVKDADLGEVLRGLVAGPGRCGARRVAGRPAGPEGDRHRHGHGRPLGAGPRPRPRGERLRLRPRGQGDPRPPPGGTPEGARVPRPALRGGAAAYGRP